MSIKTFQPRCLAWAQEGQEERGQEETSTSQVGPKKGFGLESPTASSLVASMSMEELRSFCRVPNNISLEL